MKPHEIENEIGEQLGNEASAFWNGACEELRNEMVILAQRDNLDAAITEVEALALPSNETMTT